MRASADRELEQLCCLGLPGELLVPELLARLHGVAGSRANLFFWFDERCEVSNAYAEDPAFYAGIPLYFEKYYKREEFDLAGVTHAGFMRRPEPMDDFRSLVRDDRRLQRSGFYNEMFRSQGFTNITYLKLREGGRPVGMVLLGTDEAKPGIDAAERRRLARLAPFIAHALAAPKSFAAGGYEDDDFGVLVFDRAGVLKHMSASARMLLFLATHAQAGARQRFKLEIPEQVRRLSLDLGAALSGNGAPRGAPTHVIDNRWGRFAFRAYPLEPLRPEEGLIGVIVQRQVPTALALWRKIRDAGLPPKQAEVCFHLANGRAYADIAKAMGVSINTVTWHVREIYARFDVHSSAELSRVLLSR